jgi:hypothetical protein
MASTPTLAPRPQPQRLPTVRPARRRPPQAPREGPAPPLRPTVGCLARWLDLNA